MSNRGVRLTEVCVKQRCPSHGDVCLTEVSASQVCVSKKQRKELWVRSTEAPAKPDDLSALHLPL